MSQEGVYRELMKVYPEGLRYYELMELLNLSYGAVLESVRRLKKWGEARSVPNGRKYIVYGIVKKGHIAYEPYEIRN